MLLKYLLNKILRDCQEELSVGTFAFAKILIAGKQKSKSERKEAELHKCQVPFQAAQVFPEEFFMYFRNHLEKWIGHTDGKGNHHGWVWGCLVWFFF